MMVVGGDSVLDKLLEEAKSIKPAGEDYGVPYYGGVEYEKWVSKGIIFIEEAYGDKEIGKRFLRASENSSRKESFETMLGILQSLKEFE